MASNPFADLFAGLAPGKTSTAKKSYFDMFAPVNPTSPMAKAPAKTAAPNMSVAPPAGMVGMSTPQGPKYVPLTASPGATSPAPAPIAASPKQQYINSSMPTQPTGPAKYGDTVTDSMGRTGVAKFDPNTGKPLEDPNAPPPPKADPYRDAFETYYKSLAMPEGLVKNQNRLADVESEIFGKELSGRRQYEAALDTPGGTTAGARQSAQMLDRRNNSELADLAVQQNALANSVNAGLGQYGVMSEAQKARYDFESGLLDSSKEEARYQDERNAPFDLSEGESRYEYNKETGKYEQIASKGKTYAPGSGGSGGYGGFSGVLSPLAQAVQNGTIAIDKIPIAERARVAAELATSGIPTARQQALQTNLSIVEDLLNENTNAIAGVGQNPLNALGLANNKALNLYNQLKGTLSLEKRELLKGSGAISDFEFKVLQQAATALGRNLNNADFRAELEKIRDVFAGKYALTNATGAAPTGGDNSDPLGLGL